MSIKTNKRLALGVIAALVFAPFAAIAPASAAPAAATPFYITDAEVSSSSNGDGTATGTASQVAGANNFITLAASIDGAAGAYIVDVTGSEIISAVAATNGSAVSINTAKTKATYAAETIFSVDLAGSAQVRISTATVGTITVTVTKSVISNGVSTNTLVQTYTVTVNAAAVAGVPVAAKSTAALTYVAPAAAVFPTTDATATNIAASNGTAFVYVLFKDANDAITAATVDSKVTVTSGPCLVNEGIGNPGNGKVLTLTAASGDGVLQTAAGTPGTGGSGIRVDIKGDGTATGGDCVVSIEARKDGATAYNLIATKTVKLYGAVTKYTATVVQAVGTANAAATTDAILVSATDANGVAVPGSLIYAYSSDATVATVETSDSTEATAIVTSGARPATLVAATPIGSVGFNVTGLTGKSGNVTITFGNGSTLATSTITTTATVGISEIKANSIVLTADKTTYLPGEKVTLTLTARDKNGRVIADGPGTALLAAALTPSSAITSTLFGADVATRSGIATASFFAPLIPGTVVLSGTSGAAAAFVETLYAGSAITLSIPVALPVVPVVVPPVVYDNPTLSFVKDGGRVILSGTAVDGEGDIIIYTKKVGTTAWKERAKTLEVAAPGDFNGSIKAPKSNVLIRVKQEGTGQFSNQIIVLK